MFVPQPLDHDHDHHYHYHIIVVWWMNYYYYCYYDDDYIVVDIKQSNFYNVLTIPYYINLGFLPKEMAQDASEYSHPRHEKCPVRLRIDDLLPNTSQEIAETLDLEKETFTPDDRIKRVREFMVSIAPTLDRLLTIEGLRRAYADGTFRRALIMLRAKALLGGSE